MIWSELRKTKASIRRRYLLSGLFLYAITEITMRMTESAANRTCIKSSGSEVSGNSVPYASEMEFKIGVSSPFEPISLKRFLGQR